MKPKTKSIKQIRKELCVDRVQIICSLIKMGLIKIEGTPNQKEFVSIRKSIVSSVILN